ncbi:MAG: ABC transporter ATP-binding protein [Patescibacteria group bacterium]
MIDLQSVSKTFQMGEETIHALDSVDLQVKKGEFIALIGPSGSGKSTLANVVGGLDVPDEGQILIDGQDISKTSDKELSSYRNKKVGFIFQNFNLQPTYTALENVMVPLLFAKVSPRKRKQIALQCLQAVGLERRKNHRPGQLSGGERQRVCIARALSNSPEIIIADEPTGNLDSKKTGEIIDVLKKLNKEKEITLIVITHDMAVAKQADRVLEILDGKIK